MSAAAAEMAAEPWVLCTGAEMRAGVTVRPVSEPTPAPVSGIRLVVATVKALGTNATLDNVVARCGLSRRHVETLLPAGVDVGLLTRERRGNLFVYHLASLAPAGSLRGGGVRVGFLPPRSSGVAL